MMHYGAGRLDGAFHEGFLGLNRFGYGGYIAMAIGLILLVLLLIWMFKKGNLSSVERNESPLALLQKRFVNGDISQEEFISKKEILKK